MRRRYKILTLGLILIGIVAMVIYYSVFFNPFYFGPCDGEGKPNRYEKIYYDNGQIEIEGQLKNCVWDGLIKTYYKTGELKSKEQRTEGRNHGNSIFFYSNGMIYKEEIYNKGELVKFKIISPNSNLEYEYHKSDRLKLFKVV